MPPSIRRPSVKSAGVTVRRKSRLRYTPWFDRLRDGMLCHMKARTLVARNVRRIRLKRGISQERLACEAGIDRSYMASLERQSKSPTIDVLDRIAGTLGVQLFEFFVRPSKRAETSKTLPKSRKLRPGHGEE
ncbi:helix-turn-helix transcriptional regulator [Bradyrhizobium sp. LB11.1]|uniref:helix-turn-helix domain-containing protein n=1 Tax=Bradyrhizobium sp. LB11.1 TaxID=3156326 RepID=UPI0033924306